MRTFLEWMQSEMAAMTATRFGAPIANLDTKDDAGLKHMARPGFRDTDRGLIQRDSPAVERKLTAATEKYGVHWVIGYLEPPEGAREENEQDWEEYDRQARKDGLKILDQFKAGFDKKSGAMPPDKGNTIVYIKPTSRVHSLTPHEQVHNIGHALWLRNPDLMAEAKKVLAESVRILQQSAYDADPSSPPPTEDEITVILARLIDLLSFQRVLTLQPGDLDSSMKTALTALNAYDEALIDLIPAFVNAGGQINLYPRGAGKLFKQDRAAAIPPNPEVSKKRGVRPWVWEKMAADRGAWAEVSKKLTDIVVRCLRASTWERQGGPVYPYKKLTTKP